MFDDSDWFNILIKIVITVLVFCVIFVLGLVAGGAILLSVVAR